MAAAGVRSCPLKILEEGLHISGWKSVPKDTGPNWRGSTASPWFTLNELPCPRILPAVDAPAGPGRGRLASPRMLCTLGEFSHYLFMNT